jgi:hypothetical protein
MKFAALMLAAALGCGAFGAHAATKQAAHAAAPQPPAAQVDPQAVAAMVKMSAYLRTLQTFQITLQTQRDDVDVYGQLVTLSGKATYKVRRPDGLAIDLAMPMLTRQYFYDGKTLTVFDPKTGYYAKVQAPPTVRETLPFAKQQYGVELPLEDLFTWTEGDDRTKALTSAHYVGKTQVGDQTADQYAFRQPGIDWQIWIAAGDKPTPLRVVIVAANDLAHPQFESDIAWDFAVQFADDTFAFTPPANAREIQIHPLAAR